jgi:redox-sensitive bicupin YhaK (pirin superfamily)
MQRTPLWIRDVVPGSNPAQTDRNQAVIPFGTPGTDPFLFLMEDWFSSTGFDWHPHRGFETVTYVIDGELEHEDNTGAKGVLQAGDLQWTTTGSGVLHREIAHEHKGVHTLQLWLNLPAAKKMSRPKYQDLRAAQAPVVGAGPGGELVDGAHGAGATARVFAGVQHGVVGHAELLHPAGVVDVKIQSGGRYVLEVPGDHFGFVYCIRGAVRVGDETYGAGQVAGFMPSQTPGKGDGPDSVTLEATEGSHLVAYHGLPIGEPVFAHGPFVMNTRGEIVQTVRDYQSGKFGEIPT